MSEISDYECKEKLREILEDFEFAIGEYDNEMSKTLRNSSIPMEERMKQLDKIADVNEDEWRSTVDKIMQLVKNCR
jgi:GTP-binding protein EngB required for normal cell division